MSAVKMIATGQDSGGNLLIACSPDYGTTWSTATIPPAVPVSYIPINVANNGTGTWVSGACGISSSTLIYSTATDGKTWNVATTNSNVIQYLSYVAYGNGKFVACGYGDTSSSCVVAYSTTGQTWTKSNATLSNTFGINSRGGWAVFYKNNTWILCGQMGGIYSNTKLIATSSDAVTWTTINSGSLTYAVYSIDFDGTNWVATGYGSNSVIRCTTLGTWTDVAYFNLTPSVISVSYDSIRKVFFTSTYGNNVIISNVTNSTTPPSSWTSVTDASFSGTNGSSYYVTSVNSIWYKCILGASPKSILYSSNQGSSWNWYSTNTSISFASSISIIPQTPIVGSAPIITRITPILNGLIIDFSQNTVGIPAPTYYASLNSGTTFYGNGFSSSPITILDLSSQPYNMLCVVSSNSVGNISSLLNTGSPFLKGTVPSIILVNPIKDGFTVRFNASTGGIPSYNLKYYYSLDVSTNPQYIGTGASTFDIPGLTGKRAYTIYILAISSDVSSNPIWTNYDSSSATPYYTGSAPTINSVTAVGENNLRVAFTNQTTPGNPSAVTYSYSYNSNGSSPVATVTGSPFDISTSIARTVYVVVTNAAGVVVSNGITRSPNVKGSIPTLTLTPGINKLTVNFSQTTTGTPSPEYYYSYSDTGSPAIGPVTSPIDISNITTAKTVYIDASNAAGHVFSSGVTETPYYTGSAPTITSVVASGLNNLRVTFSNQITPGNPSITTYYYSFDGSSPIGPVTSPFDISNISTTQTVYINASNDAGTVVSSGMSGTPYISGTNPTIDSIVPGLNKLTVSYSGSTGGNPSATYYYSLDGSTNLALIGTGTTPFVIAGLTNVSHSVSIVAKGLDSSSNTIWTSNSSTSYSTPYGAGTTPSITQITPGTNQLSIYYNQSTGGYPDPTYYYSVDGSTNPVSIGAYSSPYTITNLSGQSHSIYILTKGFDSSGNPVWTSYDMSYGTPHYTGSKPTITGITPGANKLTVAFSQSTLGTSPTAYYYSFDGTTQNGPANYPTFDISNLTQQTTVYIIASNVAGTMVSDPSSSAPILFSVADPPTNVTVTPLLNSLKIDFTKSSGGNPDPTYYYSLDNAPYQFAAASTDTSFVIPNLNTATMHTIQLKGDSIAGPTSVVTVSGEPLIIADPPTNVTLTPLLNSLKIDFTKSSGGNPDPTYYYSLDNAPYQFAAASTDTSFAIPNLTTLKYYNINFRGNSTAGSTSVVSVTGQPYINGTTPTVTSITPGINHMTVAFTSSGGNPDPIYYYSLDGLNPVKIGSYSSPIDISGVSVGPHTVTILVYAIDASNNTIWESSSNLYNGTSYGVGTKPTITSIVPGPGNNSLFVAFSSSAGGNPEATYYYSLDGSSSLVTIGKDASSVLISELTSTTHTVAIVARGLDASSTVQWTNASDASSAIPYYSGSSPSITGVIPGLNQLTVLYSASTGGYPAPTYYYSLDGSTDLVYIGADISSVVIGSLSNASHSVSIVAKGIGANSNTIWSRNSTISYGTPYGIGTVPNITRLSPGTGLNQLKVYYNPSTGGNPTPKYYYSIDVSTNPQLIGAYTSPYTIAGLSGQSHAIYILAEGVDSESNLIWKTYDASSSTPNYAGSVPSITNITPGLNQLTVSYNGSVGGNPSPTYYYSLDGSTDLVYIGADPGNSPFVISALTDVPHSVSIVAKGIDTSSNTIWSATSELSYCTPYDVGTIPYITGIVPETNQLKVYYAESNGGTPVSKYYYSVDVSTNPVQIGDYVSPVTIPGLSNQSHTIYILAEGFDSASNLIWVSYDVSSATPYYTGSAATIDSVVASGLNNLVVSFSNQTTPGNPPTAIYYYSYDPSGANPIGPVTSPFSISAATAKTIYIDVSNAAGMVVSSGMTGAPYVSGSTPSITGITPGVNQLTVAYNQSTGGNPTAKYYYSVDVSTNPVQIGAYSSPYTINGLSDQSHSIYILADGVDSESNLIWTTYDVSSATPYYAGSGPSNVTATPLLNSLKINFTPSIGVNPPPTYYYSLDNGAYQFAANPADTSFIILNLTVPINHTIQLLGNSIAGPTSVATVSGTPLVIAGPPTNVTATPLLNSLKIDFTKSSGGNPDPTYYYALDNAPYQFAANPTDTSFVILGLNTATMHTIQLKGNSTAGPTSAVTVSGEPLIVAGPPTNVTATPLLNSLKIDFAKSSGGNPAPTYYYALDNGEYQFAANPTDTSFVILGLNTATIHTISLKGNSAAGPTSVVSISGEPLVIAGPPTNVTATPLLNSLKIDFAKSSGGNPAPTYYYALDNGAYQFAANPTDTSFVILGLTTATMHTIQIKGNSTAGPTSVATVTGTPLVIAGPPTNVTATPLLNSIKVGFVGSSGGNPDPTYYYALDNGAYQFAANPTDTSFVILGLNTATMHTIQLKGNSTAGPTSVVSITGQSHVKGTTPTITSITSGPGLNRMSVAYTSSTGGYPDPVYYYSLDGLNPTRIGTYSSPIDISGVSVGPHTVSIYVLARDTSNNTIWECSSNLYNGTVYGVGTKPTITSITPGNNSLFVAFSSSAGGNPSATYYYSLDGSSSLVTIGKDASSVLISNLSAATHTVAIVARGLDVSSAVQWAVTSDASSAIPYYKGSIPAISGIAPGTNKITVTFSQSSLGTSPTTYYYSYSADGSNPVRAVTSPFDISNITQQKTVYVVASNIAGNLVSTGVTGTPNVFGATPSVSVTPGPNKLTVSFSQSSLGTSPTMYYYSYSADGSSPFGPVGPINPLGPVTSSSFDISNITQPKIVYIVASNPAGNLVSNGVTGTPYILGNAPSIDQVTPNTNSLQVSFSQTVKGTSPIAYYYSYSADGANRMGPVVSPFYILGLSNQTYTVYLVASNPAGNVVSTGVAGTPNTFGSTPSVSVTPGLKKLTFSFSQSVLGTSPTTYSYSYSADGSDPVRTVTSPFDISNITQSQTIYIVASNPAGNIVSNAATGAPYILGSNPTGYAVSGTNKVTISFSQSVLGTSPTEYYYSYSSDGSNRIGAVTSPFDILNITTSKTIYIVASNPAGNVVSGGIAGTPNVVGSKPVITNLTPGINNMRVSFSQLNVGSPASTYYYSYQQTGPNYNWLGPVTSPFYVSGLTNTTPYSFYILATNVAGNVASDASYATPEVFGSKPIVGVVPGNNKLTVSFSQTTLGTSTTTYHYFYLVDGSNQVGPVGPVESPFDMSGLSNREYTVYVVASNDAGNIASDGVKALPYFIGNPPTITGIVGGMNRLTVQFAGSFGGNPTPTYYYYSLDGGPYTSALVSNSQFVVPDLINDVSYSVTMIAQNIAGYTAASNTLIGKPKHVGDILETPVISHAESGFNVLIIHLEPNVVGPTPTYYTYSIDQVNYILAEETASPIIITGLKEGTVYTVTVKSHTDSGDSIASDEYGAMTLSVTGFYRELYKGSIRFRALIIGPNPIHKQSLIRKFH